METLLRETTTRFYGPPHSLGKLIEWKQGKSCRYDVQVPTPHSLGKLIEWKLDRGIRSSRNKAILPTRWGN